GGLQLGSVATTRSLDVTVTGGDLTQSGTSQIDVGNTTTLRTTGDIVLSGQQNQFRGPVSLDANAADIVQSIGDFVLDVVHIASDLTAQSVEGNLLQTSTGTVAVGNESTFTARREISLLNPGNDFSGTVQVDAPIFRLQSQTPLTLTETGAALADEASAKQAQTVNDTFIRPSATNVGPASSSSNASAAWLSRFTTFIGGLFQGQSSITPPATLVPADVAVDSADVFIRTQKRQ
ncbi:unnamed protein product, partial [Hapterophycus canaliculatus]